MLKKYTYKSENTLTTPFNTKKITQNSHIFTRSPNICITPLHTKIILKAAICIKNHRILTIRMKNHYTNNSHENHHTNNFMIFCSN